MPPIKLITPDWIVPDHIVAASTTRQGGVSTGGFASLNLAAHVEDDPQNVIANRKILRQYIDIPAEPEWLNQTHSIDCVNLDLVPARDADAAFTATPGRAAVVLTADCLPVLFCNQRGSEVAAAHAGWRGLLNGVLEATVHSLSSAASELSAWMGPAIGPRHFEVGEEVRSAFIQHDPNLQAYFNPNRPGHYLADLYAIARTRLKNLGIKHISGGQHCTYAEQDRFFSYRREKNCGRQASLIYIRK